MAFDKTKPAGSDLIADLDTILQANFAVLAKKSIFWLVGYPVVGTSGFGGTLNQIQYTMPTAGTITKVWINAVTSPTGDALIFDININGTSIWNTTQANRIQLEASDADGKADQTSFDTTAFSAGDVITLDCDQVGSTAAGVGVTIQLDYELA